MSNYHVTKDKENNQWRIKKEGADRASEFADTQKAAEKIAKQFAANSGGGEVKIHSPKGPIIDSDTVAPGHDLAQLTDLMARDKKAVDGFTFVLDGPRGVEVVSGIDRDVIEATLEEMQ